jgi:hypothetical protein
VQAVRPVLYSGASALLAVIANWQTSEIPLLKRVWNVEVVDTTVEMLDEVLDRTVTEAEARALA